MNMRLHIYAMGRGVFLFDQVVTVWSDGIDLRIQHHQDHISIIPMGTVQEIMRIDDEEDSSSFGWADGRLREVA